LMPKLNDGVAVRDPDGVRLAKAPRLSDSDGVLLGNVKSSISKLNAPLLQPGH